MNTFRALKNVGVRQVIDGYGFFPYNKYGISFIPQLFYKNKILPFGIQSTQIHINSWNAQDFEVFKNFIEANLKKKIIDYDYALSKVNDNFYSSISRYLIEYILRLSRLIKFKF